MSVVGSIPIARSNGFVVRPGHIGNRTYLRHGRHPLIAARCEPVELGACLHGPRLVRPFGIALTNEIVEAGLLLQAVHAGRPGGLGHPRTLIWATPPVWINRIPAPSALQVDLDRWSEQNALPSVDQEQQPVGVTWN